MSTARVEPFPWHSLESLHRSELLSQRALRATAARFIDIHRLPAAAQGIFELDLSVRFRSIRTSVAGQPSDAAFVVGAAHDEASLLVELEAAAAHRLLASALGQRDPMITHNVALSPHEAGALAAALLSCVRRTRAPVPPTISSAGAGRLAQTWREQHPDSQCALFTLILADEAYDARVSFDAAAHRPPSTLFGREQVQRLASTPLGLSVVLGSALLSREDLEKLAPGDAWMPGVSVDESETPILLCAPASETALSAALRANGTIAFHGKRVELPWSIVVEELSMKDDNAISALENAPVVVRVEIGTCELSAREWAELEPGDVISLKQRVGDPVSLRAGGVEIARGELVQIEGEIGVRILSRQPS